MRNGRNGNLRRPALTLVLASVVALGLGSASVVANTQPLDTRSAAPSANDLERLPSFADLVEKVSPAVVSIIAPK